MKRKFSLRMCLVAVLLFCLVWADFGTARAESLYEFYAHADRNTLTAETGKIGRELRQTFQQTDVARRQSDIDFAEYFANLKRLAFYSSKLASYSDYERDLEFARDKEIFKGLPHADEEPDATGPGIDRKAYISAKYERMKKNVEEEISTYQDLIRISLDACQSVMENNPQELLAEAPYKDKVNQFMTGQKYQQYQDGYVRLAGRWPKVASRIDAQFDLWKIKPRDMKAPIIDSTITEALK